MGGRLLRVYPGHAAVSCIRAPCAIILLQATQTGCTLFGPHSCVSCPVGGGLPFGLQLSPPVPRTTRDSTHTVAPWPIAELRTCTAM